MEKHTFSLSSCSSQSVEFHYLHFMYVFHFTNNSVLTTPVSVTSEKQAQGGMNEPVT